MKKYEVIIILSSKLKEADAKVGVKKELDIITKANGKVLLEDFWGLRELAYEIEKQNHGYYVVVQFESDTQTMQEFNRVLSLNDNVIRSKCLKVGK